MRLGGYFAAGSIGDLEPLCARMDVYGLSATFAPGNLAKMDADACAAYGEKARSLGLVLGEAGLWENLMTADPAMRAQRIQTVRLALQKAEAMRCRCVVTLIGSRHPSEHPLAPHPYMHTEECKREFRETVLRILDGLDLKHTMYGIEPWHNTFFYDPQDIRDFIDRVGHPRFGIHLDQMNMVSQRYYDDTTALINKTFDLLSDRVASVHLKDIRCDPAHMFLKWDEVNIGDGVMDYETFLKRLSRLPADTTCFCEHMAEERDYALNFARLHHIAGKVGVRFLKRGET
jgi:sugar phosphate isomerase/epimerase